MATAIMIFVYAALLAMMAFLVFCGFVVITSRKVKRPTYHMHFEHTLWQKKYSHKTTGIFFEKNEHWLTLTKEEYLRFVERHFGEDEELWDKFSQKNIDCLLN